MAKSKDNATGSVKSDKSLEQSMQELSDIVTKMERGGMPLEETFELYKEGMALLKQCRTAIDGVEKELQILEDDGDDDEHTES
ncbi:MAG: exodeoxyribonuclease VII small subunit [Lachnospiraceae bacterium]|nr:exodeoxyribonuclease VII small subunit [Lachnospiraceae bacterium]